MVYHAASPYNPDAEGTFTMGGAEGQDGGGDRAGAVRKISLMTVRLGWGGRRGRRARVCVYVCVRVWKPEEPVHTCEGWAEVLFGFCCDHVSCVL
jgi:hypothetical protein